MATYRPNVAAILRKPKSGKIFIAERSDHKGSWNFPQGGVDDGEDLISALYREVFEETGVSRDQYEIVGCRTTYRYKFPGAKLKRGIWCGQDQTYFLCDFHGKKNSIDLTNTKDNEFRNYMWIYPQDFNLAWIPEFKRPVFRRVFNDFFGVKVKYKAIPS